MVSASQLDQTQLLYEAFDVGVVVVVDVGVGVDVSVSVGVAISWN